jgi:hypothetical protein
MFDSPAWHGSQSQILQIISDALTSTVTVEVRYDDTGLGAPVLVKIEQTN